MNNISVLMSLYAKENPIFFEKCLASLVVQTVMADEIVIVFDGPQPKALSDIVSSYSHKLNLVVVNLEQNVGLAKALNIGIENCSGAFIARLDTDDYCYPNRLELQLAYFSSNEVDIVGSFATVVDNSGCLQELRTSPITNDEIYKTLWCNPLIHPSVMFKKSTILMLDKYNEKLRRRQDYDLWFRAAKFKLKFYNIPLPLIYYRFDESSHKKQTLKLAFEQGIIGFNGTKASGLGQLRAMLCFYPFLRTLLPTPLQNFVRNTLHRFDPRG
ncbi:MAG: glycosyltransferase involved in cell wall biosynthesis [Alteromonadaceae bacterium]|jgi:glycosyltransferase involved in cell wall biosynthesis